MLINYWVWGESREESQFDWDVTITSLLKQKGSEMKAEQAEEEVRGRVHGAARRDPPDWGEGFGAKFDKKLRKGSTGFKDKVKLITEEEEEVMEKSQKSLNQEVAKAEDGN